MEKEKISGPASKGRTGIRKRVAERREKREA
jgi:hypothetical protein